ncbi:MAG: caspase, EACC1-associated type [Pseudonocardiaceae bacterium]
MYRALIVCNSRFSRDPSALPELQGPKTDGTLLRDALTDSSVGLFERSEVRFLPEAEAPEVVAAIDDFFGAAEADDALLFYYSGHGRSRNRQLFLCAGNTMVERLNSTAVAESTLSNIISGSFAQVKIVILDCCHSGVFKGGDLVDGLSGKGRFVIAATSATDRANDAGIRGEPSPFTKALVNGLLTDATDRDGDHLIDLDDLFTHLTNVKFDGHEPHRKFDGAGAVPIGRRTPKSVATPLETSSRLTRPEGRDHTTRATPNPAFLDDIVKAVALSEKRIDEFREVLRDDIANTLPSQLTSTEFLQRAGLVNDGHPTRAGVLLFGENPTALLPAAMVRCVRFDGARKTDPVESLDLHGTIPELIVQARDFVAGSSLLGESPVVTSAYSETRYRYPMIAVREIIANAVVHRDYSNQDTCVQIHIFDDRIEVISPGAWGGEQTVPDGQVRLSTLEGPSQPRNFRLARILAWGKLVESVGAGLPRSVADCRAVGSPEPIVMIRHRLITVTIFPGDTESPVRDVTKDRVEVRAKSSPQVDPGRMAQIIVTNPDNTARFRGSGYRVTNDTVLTSAHLVRDGIIHVRFPVGNAEWDALATIACIDKTVDVAVLRFDPPVVAPVVAPVRYGRITTNPAVVAVETAGFPYFKRYIESSHVIVQDLASLPGTTSSMANLRSGTLEINVDPPGMGPENHSPWEGMSGAPVWAEGRIVGVITSHNVMDGLGRLAAARIERFLNGSSFCQEHLTALLELAQPLEVAEVPYSALAQPSPYLEQIRALVPPAGLRDRERELAELADFCLGDEPYVLWQGGPWTGKTALMASFALLPPSDVDVVSFFVTNRITGQSDSLAFTGALIDQLAWLLDEPLPAASMQSGALDILRRRQLAMAAKRSRDQGRRLLLLVDGIDEDGGPSTGIPSIASLLPQNPSDGLRVLVTGRQTPLPADVPPNHPLRICRVRSLKPSAFVHEISIEASRELRTILANASQSRDVIGLIAASHDGVTLSDLVQLTDQAPYELETMFSGRLGRVFMLHGRGSPEHQKIFFAHEALRTRATELLGHHLMSTYVAMIQNKTSVDRERATRKDDPSSDEH